MKRGCNTNVSITKYDIIFVIIIKEKFLRDTLISKRNFCKNVRDLVRIFFY